MFTLSAFRRLSPSLLALPLVALLVLAGCKSSEEKAEDYYQSALVYMQKDDVDRALIELRNVFKYNGFHKEARQLYADAVLAQGNVAEAYSQYLRLIEQYPDTLPVRIRLAELALKAGNWDEVERHGKAAIALAPDDPAVQAIATAIDYRAAVLAKDDTAKAAVAARAEALLKANPDSEVARRVAIEARISGADPASAMPLVEAAIARDPKAIDYQMLRFQILAQEGQTKAASEALEAVYALAPENETLRNTLISWYLQHKDFDGAEALLRRIAGPDDGPIEGHVTLIQFLLQAHGAEMAEKELDRLIAATDGKEQQAVYRGLKAGMQFQAGAQEEAIAEMRTILKDAPDNDQTRNIQLSLAQMLAGRGDQVGARELVEKVLAADPNQVAALKMRAAWLIREDQPDAAIVDLRTALNGAPRDVDILLLMAEAYERAGSRDLAGERLALAVEVSNSAPAVALRYAQFLLQDGKAQSAETVLALAHKRSPGDVRLIQALADIWLKQQNWPQLQAMIAELQAIDSEAARALVGELQAAILLRQDRTEDGLAALEKQFSETGSDRALVLLVMTRLRNGEIGPAREAVAEALGKEPDDIGIRLLAATVEVAANDIAKAEEMLRALIADAPGQEQPVRMLASLLISGGNPAAAAELLDTAIGSQPKSVALRLMRAGLHEQAKEFDAAIAIYEALYAENSGNLVVANNLASLLADHRTDAESLERAATIARRLRGLDQPAFQDTYGWILYRQGNLAEALPALETAVKGLPDDPLVQVHIGLTYLALGRDAEAKPHLERALELAGNSDLPQFAEAKAALSRIAAATAEN